jgi:hypothetical protein
LGEGQTTPHRAKPASYKMLHRASDWDGFFGMTGATENGREIWSLECQESEKIIFFEKSIERISKL